MTERSQTYMPLADLAPNPVNPKAHSIDGIQDSVTRFGFVEPVTIDERTGMLISGHGRVEALSVAQHAGQDPPDGVQVDSDGSWQIPVNRGWASKDDTEASAALVALNRYVEKGGWNDTALADLLQGLTEGADDPYTALEGVGFTPDDLAELLDRINDHPYGANQDPDAVPDPPKTPVSKRGDLWLCGKHRVLCGDSTVAEDVARLMGDEKADLVWTDPPYGVEYVGKTKDALTIQNDGAANLRRFLAAALTAVSPSVQPGSPFYLASPPGRLATDIRLAISDAGWEFHQALVWVKDAFVLGHSDYHYRHEDILYGWLPGPGRSGRGAHQGSRWHGDHSQQSVFEVPRPKRSEEHPTMKPVDLITPMLANSSKPRQIVLDLFGGSGSTLIACQQTHREARLIEIDPVYTDVILRRYQEFTGDQPVLEATGEPHDFTAG